MILDEPVSITVNNTNIAHFLSLGYDLPVGKKSIIEVRTTELCNNSHALVKAVCSGCGCISQIPYSKYYKAILNRGVYVCYTCSRNKPDFSEVASYFTTQNCTLLSTEYKNNKMPLSFFCNKHPNIIQQITYGDFKRGRHCKYCNGPDYNSWRRKRTTDTILYLRQQIEPWKNATKSFWANTCILTKVVSSKNHVHHVVKPFKLILDDTLAELRLELLPKITDYPDEVSSILIHKFLQNHNNVGLGICLTPKLHNKFHSEYGKNDNLDDFIRFWRENRVEVTDKFEWESINKNEIYKQSLFY